MTTQRFRTVLIKKNGGGVIVPIPFNPDEVWGVKDKHHIAGKVCGCAVRGALELQRTEFVLSLGPAWTRHLRLPDTEVEAALYPEGPQVDQLSEDIREAFATAPEARKFFE